MSSSGKVRVVVRTRRVPVGTALISAPVFSASGVVIGSRTDRMVVFDSRLDEAHRRAINEGRRLSCALGLELEVIDSAKRGGLRGVLSYLGGRSGGPTIVVSPSTEPASRELPQPLSGADRSQP